MLLFSSADLFFFQNKLLKLFQKHYQSVKQFRPDQDQQNVGPDLGLDCLQRLSADDRSRYQQEKVTSGSKFHTQEVCLHHRFKC